mgnify:CR=1 FL=1
MAWNDEEYWWWDLCFSWHLFSIYTAAALIWLKFFLFVFIFSLCLTSHHLWQGYIVSCIFELWRILWSSSSHIVKIYCCCKIEREKKHGNKRSRKFWISEQSFWSSRENKLKKVKNVCLGDFWRKKGKKIQTNIEIRHIKTVCT